MDLKDLLIFPGLSVLCVETSLPLLPCLYSRFSKKPQTHRKWRAGYDERPFAHRLDFMVAEFIYRGLLFTLPVWGRKSEMEALAASVSGQPASWPTSALVLTWRRGR